MNIYVSIDERGYTKKPEREIVSIKKMTVENWRCMEVRELADLVGNKGFAIVPGHLVGGMKSSNCTEMQLFALDFDHGVSYRETGSISGNWQTVTVMVRPADIDPGYWLISSELL